MKVSSAPLTHILVAIGVNVGVLSPCCSAIKNIILEDFGDIKDGDEASAVPSHHSWYALTDPVMGGQSVGTATAAEGLGIFTGEVKTVPSLDAPGFIAMQTRGGWWPDLNSCQGLQVTAMSGNDYSGFQMSFGQAHVTGNSPYARGFKAPFQPSVGEYTDQFIPFSDFSDDWDAATGEILVSCDENSEYCPDEESLKDLHRFEIMAEGVNGQIDLKIKFIKAIGCADDVEEDDPNPDEHMQGGRGNQWGGRGGGRGGSGSRTDVEFVGNVRPEILKNGDVRIEKWPNPRHAWFALNDPVMGGQSTSTVAIEDDVCIFEGEVVDVPSLNAPGFIKMETRGGEFADVSHCNALKIEMKAPLDYDGLHVTFGVHHAEETMPYVRGYKAPLSITNRRTSEFQEIILPFTDFSDNWDPSTGDIKVSCQENSIHCPDEATLRYFTTFSIMGEGVDGKVRVEIKSIDAVDCEYEDTNGGGRSSAWVGVVFGMSAAIVVGFFMGRRTGTAGYHGSGSSRGSLFGAVAGFFRRDGIEHQSTQGIAVTSKIVSPPLTSLRQQVNANDPY